METCTYFSPVGIRMSPPLEGCHPSPHNAELCGSVPSGSARTALEHKTEQGRYGECWAEEHPAEPPRQAPDAQLPPYLAAAGSLFFGSCCPRTAGSGAVA